jgi:hypothetical protein
MYKRMLLTLRKGKLLQKYAVLLDLVQKDEKTYILEMDLPSAMEVHASVLSADNTECFVVKSGMAEQGKHNLEFNIETLQAGRYTLLLKTESQSVKRYFEVV